MVFLKSVFYFVFIIAYTEIIRNKPAAPKQNENNFTYFNAHKKKADIMASPFISNSSSMLINYTVISSTGFIYYPRGGVFIYAADLAILFFIVFVSIFLSPN